MPHLHLYNGGPVREEEQVCESGPMHAHEDITVVGVPQLIRKWNVAATWYTGFQFVLFNGT